MSTVTRDPSTSNGPGSGRKSWTPKVCSESLKDVLVPGAAVPVHVEHGVPDANSPRNSSGSWAVTAAK